MTSAGGSSLPDVFARDVYAEPPVLRTARLVLRQITEADGEGLFAIFGSAEVTEFYLWEAFTDVAQGHELAASSAALFASREAIRWGLTLPGVPHIIGTCGYGRWSQENQYSVLGYDLARPYWGKGLMSEAVAAVLGVGFEQMNLHRVEATVMTGNTASEAVLTRAGFQREGLLRDRVLKAGQFRGVSMFGLTRPDWAARSAPA
jgi:ribosomal-protein-alanine N-acetyltransferase